eukprot:Platyproteum_vivax@DN468_c0_g1_i1.p1
MAKTKRAKPVPLTKVKTNRKEQKNNLIENVQNTLRSKEYCYVIALENQRNAQLKQVRDDLKPGRIFYGKSKVMKVALGSGPENEIEEGTHKLAKLLFSERGLLCTDTPPKEIRKYFNNFQPEEFAKSGFIPTSDIVLEKGFDAFKKFPHSMEVQLRKLGCSTSLQNGAIELIADSTVCEAGKPITPEQAQLLKLLNLKLSKFKIIPEACWQKGGKFQTFLAN